MPDPTISETLAANLAYFMTEKQIVQTELAKMAGVGQTTISLYLNPEKRLASTTGSEKSPTLARVDALAKALGVELWELLRPLTKEERDLVKSVEAVVTQKIAERVGDATKQPFEVLEPGQATFSPTTRPPADPKTTKRKRTAPVHTKS